MKKQSLALIVCVLLCGLAFARCSKSGVLSIDFTPVAAPAAPEAPTTLQVYLENSGSMDGYMGPGSQLKDAVKDFAGSLAADFDSLSLNYINSDIVPLGDDLKAFIANASSASFQTAGGSTSYTDIGSLMERMLARTGDRAVSMFVSDCILAIPQGKSTDFLTDRQIDVTRAVRKFCRRGNRSVVVIRLESSFTGKYYGQDGVTHLQNARRPYYIWLFGPTELLARALQHSPIERIKHGVSHWASFGGVQPVPFAITNKYGGAPQQMQAQGEDFEVCVKADLSRLLQPDAQLADVHRYAATPARAVRVQRVARANEPGFTHVLFLAISRHTEPCAATLSLAGGNEVPAWVDEANDDTGQDIARHLTQTTGIKHLVQGVAEAYRDISARGSISFVIQNN